MKKIIVSILITSLLVNGCSHTLVKYSNEHEFEFYTRINKLCENKDDLTIEMIDGQKYRVKELIISADTTKFTEINSDMTIIKNTKEISLVSYSDSRLGTSDGLFSGLRIGGGTGLLLGQLISGGSSGGLGRFYFFVYSVLAGVAIGLIYGYNNPSTAIIKIN